MTQKTIDEDAWISRYGPLANPVVGDGGYDYGSGSTMVQPHGAELAYLRGLPPERVWTVMDDDDGNPCIASGLHCVNRIGHIVTREPYDGDVLVELED